MYESDPIGPPQPLYLNAAALLDTSLAPEALLDELLQIEKRQGRERRERWGPRLLDLDILWIRGQVVGTERLEVPHPELERRAFALLPLLDVAPDAAHPERGRPYAALASAQDTSGVRRIAGTAGGVWHSGRPHGSERRAKARPR